MEDTNYEVSSRIEKIDTDVRKLANDVSSLRPVHEIVKYLLLFWAALSAVMAFYGWAKLSDIDLQIEESIEAKLSESSADLSVYKQTLAEAQDVRKAIEAMQEDFRKSQAFVRFQQQVGTQSFDIEGKLLRIMSEIGDRRDDPDWRTSAILAIRDFEDVLSNESAYPADFVHDVTNLSRSLRQFKLAQTLSAKAAELDNSPQIKALQLSTAVQNFAGETREKALVALMQMVEQLPESNPEIVLAEAWNASEDRRRYSMFIRSLDRLIESRINSNPRGFLPSYAYIIRARTFLRRSDLGDVKRAEDDLTRAKSRLKNESAESTWAGRTLELIEEVQRDIARSKISIDERLSELEAERDSIQAMLNIMQSQLGEQRDPQ